MGKIRIGLLAAALSLALSGCMTTTGPDPLTDRASAKPLTPVTTALLNLPPPARPINVAVYQFPDLTGAFKPNDRYADNSRAVTQGGAAIVADALNKAGNGAWFNVVEREGLKNLLRERQLIKDTYAALNQNPLELIDPLEFAEYLIEGGVVSYDNSVTSGGVGASYLGVSGNVLYNKDLVTVSLRLTSVRTGRVIISLTTSKTIYSLTVSGGLSKFVAVDDLLQISAGVSKSEAAQIAVREGIEMAVFEFIQKGLNNGLWSDSEQRRPRKPVYTSSIKPVAVPAKANLGLKKSTY
ncbi:MAG: curli production assembly protein CsgG [Hyphomicrobiales bacterium]|nr:curli production assembly protein CsgG [Hyphomicrobiales bacterium]